MSSDNLVDAVEQLHILCFTYCTVYAANCTNCTQLHNKMHRSVFCIGHILCRYHSCLETSSTDANCTWVRLHGTDTLYGTPQPSASTLVECQTACKFDPRCVEVYFWENKNTEISCYIHANTVRNLSLSRSLSTKLAHYTLLASRCNIRSGQYFYKIFFFLTSVNSFKARRI